MIPATSTPPPPCASPPPSRTPPISRGAWALHVYEQAREQIVRGVLAPGARVVEQEIAGRMGVGRTPVREALQPVDTREEGLRYLAAIADEAVRRAS